jgi:putative transposase
MNKNSPFRYFKASPEIIRLAVMYYVRFPLSLRQVEDIMHERGIDICHETVRYWWNRIGPKWRWHPDEVFVKINGE